MSSDTGNEPALQDGGLGETAEPQLFSVTHSDSDDSPTLPNSQASVDLGSGSPSEVAAEKSDGSPEVFETVSLQTSQDQPAPAAEAAPEASDQAPTEEDLNPTLARYMSACQEGELSVVKELISSGQVSANDAFSQGITGLHWAAINNRITIVKYLMENEHSRADPNKLGGTLSASPLHWACKNGLVYVVHYLLSNSEADPSMNDSQQYNALHLAVHSSNITLVIYILLKCVVIDKSIYIDSADNINCTPLHWAAYQGDILSVKALLHYGADVAKVDKNLMTPLHWGFIRGYKSVLGSLLEADSDIFHKNDKGKDSFGVAADMNCEASWHQVLKEDDRSQRRNWQKNSHLISPKMGKLITFFTPYVVLPIALNVCSFNQGYVIPKIFFSLVLIASSLLFLNKLVIPTYISKERAFFQTPFFAGVFSATAFWTVLVWFFVVFPTVWLKKFFNSIFLSLCIAAFTFTFFKAMKINPGMVPVPTDATVVFNDIQELVASGKFDTEHFCVHSFTRKPLRSKYSKANKALIAKFDHYCPWVYNDIGVRNHKLFITFTYSLLAAIFFCSSAILEYFEVHAEKMGYDSDLEDSCSILSEGLCLGFTNNHFLFNLLIWCWFQGSWITSLAIVQTFQILKGLTTWEFSSLDKQMTSPAYNHSTVPRDFDGPNGPPPPAPTNAAGGHQHKNGVATCLRLLGLDQFYMTVKLALLSAFQKTTHNESYTSIESFDIPTDYGWKQNWLDFWFLGDTEWRNLFFLPIDGENNLNGQVVDYYKLYEYPSKISGENSV